MNKILKYGAIAFVVILIIGIFTPDNETEAPAECPVVEQPTPEPQVCHADFYREKFNELEAVDSEGFVLAGQTMNACGVAINALLEGDAETVVEQAELVTQITENLEQLRVARQSIISEVEAK